MTRLISEKEAAAVVQQQTRGCSSSAIRDASTRRLTWCWGFPVAYHAAFIIDFHRIAPLFAGNCSLRCLNIYAYSAKNNEERVLATEETLVSFFIKVDTDPKYGPRVWRLVIIWLLLS
jgi:hypothetical protein